MRYTNFILTAIAILLALNFLKPAMVPEKAYAASKVMDVNIIQVAGQRISPYGGGSTAIPVIIIKNKDK